MLAIRHLAYPDTANNPDNEALTRDKGKHKKREKHIFRAYQRQTAKPFRPETGLSFRASLIKTSAIPQYSDLDLLQAAMSLIGAITHHWQNQSPPLSHKNPYSRPIWSLSA